MSDEGFGDPGSTTIFQLEERLRLAKEVTDKYKKMHGQMDVGIGIMGLLIPGAAIPGLIFSIGLQAPAIYQPLSRELAPIYLAAPEELGNVQSQVIPQAMAITGTMDIGAHFGVEFVKEVVKESLLEYGLGALASTIPFVGGVIGAGLDYAIATAMTERVGKMVSIYFQNGGQWVGSKKETYKMAKAISGDIGSIRHNVPAVRAYMLRNVKTMVEMMRNYMSLAQIREALTAKGAPDDLINEALGTV